MIAMESFGLYDGTASLGKRNAASTRTRMPAAGAEWRVIAPAA
jgi:hypothetical protein